MTLRSPTRRCRKGSLARRGLLLACWLLGGVGTNASHGTEVTDAAGRRVEIADPSRIVSVGGAVTEILYALGREERIVGVDSTSLYPQSAQAKPSVGYMRQLSAEGVLGLNPSLVLASKDSGPKETIAVLSAAKVPLVLIPEGYNGEGVIEKIQLIAAAANAEPQGACLANAVRHDLEALADLRQHIKKPVKVMFVLSLMNGRPMIAGLHTAANGIIELAGAVNAISTYSGYKQASEEAIIAAAPDVILVMQRPARP
jgi:iron complex transport system substrate-binding protein